jgi:stage III sporulation protein SpoIIIAA
MIGTAHGRTLNNLLMNPTLSDLIGGIESVTLSDEEAKRRGTQKTVLERRSPRLLMCWLRLKKENCIIVYRMWQRPLMPGSGY